MADNISMGATAGVVLTDDCTTGHAQIVKLAYSGDGVATLIPADGNGLRVRPSAATVFAGGSKTDTSDATVMPAAGASTYNYLTFVSLYNSSATNTYATIKDGTTAIAVIPLPAYGGALLQPGTPIRGTANTAFFVAAGGSVTTAYFYGGGYTGT